MPIIWYNGSMKLFDLTLENALDGAEELFVQGAPKGAVIRLKDGETASFGTYFNLLSEMYAKYCGTDEAALALEADGNYRLDFYSYTKKGEKLIKSAICKGQCYEKVPLERHASGGFVYFTITAIGGCTLHGGCWATENEPQRKAKIGMVICTYRREEFVEANLKRIAEGLDRHPEMTDALHVFVIDNAGTLDLAESDFYTVVKNRNLGGSGGFTRGICEVCADSSFTHFLLTDDDIYFDFNALERTYLLLCALLPEYGKATVGGAMLTLEKPCNQHEFGGLYDDLKPLPINNGLDMREKANLLKNENAKKPDFFGWWYCCMPTDTVQKYGLPMPFFIKRDDVEYCIRAMRDPIITSGIAVWHRDFTGKYSTVLEYYRRNEVVTGALVKRGGRLKNAVRFAYFAFKNFTLKNYAAAELLIRGYEDFFRGPQFFYTADSQELNDELREFAPKWHSPEDIFEQCGVLPDEEMCGEEKRTGAARNVLRTLMAVESFAPSFLFSKKPAVTTATNPRATDGFFRRTVIHFDPAQNKGFVCTLDTKLRRALRRRAAKIFFRLIFSFGKIRKLYLKNADKMCSRENWNRLFFPAGKN